LRLGRVRKTLCDGIYHTRDTEFDEPGVFMAFEENAEELAVNVHRWEWM